MTILSSEFSSGVLDGYLVREIIVGSSAVLPTNLATSFPAYLSQFASPLIGGIGGLVYHISGRKTPVLLPNGLSGAPNASKLQGAAVGATVGAFANTLNFLPVFGQLTEPAVILVGSQVGRMMG